MFQTVVSFLALLAQFWNIALTSQFLLDRYHHTGPVTAFYALRESLAVLVEEVGHVFELDIFLLHLSMHSTVLKR